MATSTVCMHHWLIEAPRGKISRGVCKRCGKRRNFPTTGTSERHWVHRGPAKRV